MGTVFLGRSTTGEPVAVKIIKPEHVTNTEFRRRFANEIEAAKRVGGFFTAGVRDADPGATPPWLVTDYIQGPSLRDAVERHGPLPPETVRRLGAGLLRGLNTIHDCDLVHRDLKPANVILTARRPMVIDFGIARALDQTPATITGHAVGTPAYMSPEQATGDTTKIGPASDVFSFGCVLAYAATGRSPFQADDYRVTIHRIIHSDPDLTGIPPELRDLVASCLVKDPAARPTITRLRAGLDEHINEDWLPAPILGMIADSAPPAPEAADPTRPTVQAPQDPYNRTYQARSFRSVWVVLLAILGLLDLVALTSVLLAILIISSEARSNGLTLWYIWSHFADAAPVDIALVPISIAFALPAAYLSIAFGPVLLRSIRARTTGFAISDQGVEVDGPGGHARFAWPEIHQVTIIRSRRWLRMSRRVFVDPVHAPDLPVSRRARRHEPHIDADSGWVLLTRLEGYRTGARELEQVLVHYAHGRYFPGPPGSSRSLVRRPLADASHASPTEPDRLGVPATRVDGTGRGLIGHWRRRPRIATAIAVTLLLMLGPIAVVAATPPEPRMLAILYYSGFGASTSPATFSPDGTLIAFGDDAGVRLWSVRTRRLVMTIDTTSGYPPDSVFDRTGDLLAVTGLPSPNNIDIWNTRTHRKITTITSGNALQSPAAFTSDSRSVIAATVTKHTDVAALTIWDIASGHVTQTINNPGQSATLSPDGRTLATADEFQTFLMDAQTWKVRSALDDAPDSNDSCDLSALTFSPDSRFLTSCATGNTLVNVQTARQGRKLNLRRGEEVRAISPDNHVLAVSDGSSIRFINTSTGRQILDSLEPDNADISSLQFSPDGRTLLTGGDSLTLWSMPH